MNIFLDVIPLVAAIDKISSNNSKIIIMIFYIIKVIYKTKLEEEQTIGLLSTSHKHSLSHTGGSWYHLKRFKQYAIL